MKHYSALYTTEIERALHPLKHFLGVFASDQLLSIEHINYPASLVVNTDPLHKPGSHWIAFHFDSQSHLDYFDSQGMPPSSNPNLARFARQNATTITYCDKPLQGLYSAACGYYCIAFLALRSRGYTLSDIVSLYWGGRPGIYDELVCNDIHTLFRVGEPITKQKQKHQQIGGRKGQCCCSVADWCFRISCNA
jgi:hypothetical protein